MEHQETRRKTLLVFYVGPKFEKNNHKEIKFEDCSVLCSVPVFYLLYITNFPVVLDATTITYANDIAILMAHTNAIEASLRLQESLSYILLV